MISDLPKELSTYYSNQYIDREKVSSFWEYTLLKIYSTAIKKGSGEDFLQWDIINSTIHLPNRIEVDYWYDALTRSPLWNCVFRYAIEDTDIGKPIRFSDNCKATPTSIQNAFHLLNIGEFNIHLCEYDVIIEIGAGYGSFYRMLRRIGYKKEYIIFDLCPMIILQKSYLESVSELENVDYLEKLFFCNKEDDLKEKMAVCSGRILVVGLWSLSEMPIDYREVLLKNISDTQNVDYFFAYQKEFQEYNNQKFFEEHFDKNRYLLLRREILHHDNNYYMIIKEKDDES